MSVNLPPNLIIAGVTKGGSTSVFAYLADHPDVLGSTKKELCYFMPLRYGGQLGDFESYTANYASYSGERYRLEASPGYIYGENKIASAIHKRMPDTKIVIILREPVSRLFSFFRSHQNKFLIDSNFSFEEYVADCLERYKNTTLSEDNFPVFGVHAGYYADYLPSWVDQFGDNVYICFFDDLVQDSRGFMKKLCRWLEIDESFYDSYNFTVENKSVEYKYASLQRVAVYFNSMLERFFRRYPKVKVLFRDIYYSVNGKEKRRLSPEMRTYLQSHYAPYNEKLANFLQERGEGKKVWLYE